MKSIYEHICTVITDWDIVMKQINYEETCGLLGNRRKQENKQITGEEKEDKGQLKMMDQEEGRNTRMPSGRLQEPKVWLLSYQGISLLFPPNVLYLKSSWQE